MSCISKQSSFVLIKLYIFCTKMTRHLQLSQFGQVCELILMFKVKAISRHVSKMEAIQTRKETLVIKCMG